MKAEERDEWVEDLARSIWFRSALVLVPVCRALGARRPELGRLLERLLVDVRADVLAHVREHARNTEPSGDPPAPPASGPSERAVDRS
jgi:hypothetical protein